MTSYVTPKKNTEFIMYIGLPSTSSSGEFQSNPTLASGDVKVSTDGGAFANLTTLPSVTPAGGKSVKLTLSASEMNGDNITVVFSDATGAEWLDVVINIQTSTNQIDDLATATDLATVDGVVDSILEDTGTTLPASIAGVTAPSATEVADEVATRTLNANITKVNSVTVGGVGSSADPWNPA